MKIGFTHEGIKLLHQGVQQLLSTVVSPQCHTTLRVISNRPTGDMHNMLNNCEATLSCAFYEQLQTSFAGSDNAAMQLAWFGFGDGGSQVAKDAYKIPKEQCLSARDEGWGRLVGRGEGCRWVQSKEACRVIR